MIKHSVKCDRPGCTSVIQADVYDDLFKRMREQLWVYSGTKFHYCSKECFLNKEKPVSKTDAPVSPGSAELPEENGVD